MSYFGVPIRNGLPIGLGSVAGFGVQQFSPADLFSAGEQGAWYDPSDLTTLFTDSAGTVPVTGVEQFVGLMLDKSKGLVLGSELVTNGTFDSGVTGWSSGAATSSASAVSGEMVITTSSTNGRQVTTLLPTTAGKMYKVTGIGRVISGTGSPGVSLYQTDSSGATVLGGLISYSTTNSNLGLVFTASGATSYISAIVLGNSGSVGAFDNISVREIPGNHATSTGTKRPKLAARYNLLTYTEQFDNGAWSKPNLTIAANSTTAPDGTLTADTLTATTTGTFRTARRTGVGFVANTSFKYEVNFKKNTSDWVALRFWDTGSGTAAWFNINTGTLGTVQAGCTAAITSAGNGWYKCSITRTIGASIGFNELDIMLSSTDNSDTATTGDSIYAWGADLRSASQATGLIGPTYQRVVDAATYDTAGFLPYLEFNGLSWSMSTGSIDFTATDKMTVWAGVRKQADAVQQTIVEQSASWSANNGAFVLQAVSTNQQWGVRGTANNARNYGTYTAPITQVLAAQLTTAAANSSAAIAARIDGANVVGANDASAISTGNFGNYPFYIGARNNTSNYLNGWLTSLIVRGAQSTQSQIEATESWVNGKTGAF